MPRLSSMRSLGALTYPGILLFLVLALVSTSSPALAQPGDSAYGDQGRQGASLVNVASTVKRPDGFSSLSGIQALLYSDAVTVVHVDFTKIDYVSLKSFIDEFIENAAGQVASRDSYRVQLRKYQKDQLKDDFKNFLATVQNVVTQKLYKNNIDEVYVIKYESTDQSNPGATVLAVPLEGFSEVEKSKVVDALASFSNPLAVFIRFGFAISVVEHDSALPPIDTSAIKARYVAKTLEKTQLQQALNGATATSNNSYNDQRTGERSSMMNSSLPGDPTASATNAAMVNTIANNIDRSGNVEIDAEFRTEYIKEIEDELSENRLKSRRIVLPSIRKRYGVPASADASLQLTRALRSANGAAITIATVDVNSLIQSTFSDAPDTASLDAFSGLGKDANKRAFSFAENPEYAELVKTIANQNISDSVKSFTLVFSLVNTPQIVAFVGLNSSDDATKATDTLNQFMGVIKPLVRSFLESGIQDSVSGDVEFDVSPLIDPIFESLSPKTVDDKVAFVLNLDVVSQNANIFSSLLNGDSSAQVGEGGDLEDIDWNVDGGEDEPQDVQSDDDDPYQQDDNEDSVEKESPVQDEESESDLFDDEDEEDEDDPFA